MAFSVWLDGRLVAPEAAAVPTNDHGLVVGDGVFETVLVVAGRPFALGRHLDRLLRSAAGLGIAGLERAVLEEAASSVVAAAGLERARLRLTATSGPGPLGSPRGDGRPTVVAAIEPAADPEASAAVVVAPWARNEKGALAGLKTTSYAENVRVLAYAHERGASEAILANTAGRLCEGTGSNVFVVVGGRLLTPGLASGCLAGVTRALVLEGFGGDEDDLPLEVLTGDQASEVFLTSTVRGVQPVARVDGRARPAGGPVTTAAAAFYDSLVSAGGDPEPASPGTARS